MRLVEIPDFGVFLHNCDAVADYHCIQIYKGFLMELSRVGWKIQKTDFIGLSESGKRVRLAALVRYFREEGLLS